MSWYASAGPLHLGEGMHAELEPDEPWQDILDFERSWWSSPTQKEAAVRGRFGMSPARYYQLLNRLIDRPEALAYDPMLVRRLRRVREARRRKRFARRLGLGG
jgi:uncharacterized protein DUF3263